MVFTIITDCGNRYVYITDDDAADYVEFEDLIRIRNIFSPNSDLYPIAKLSIIGKKLLNYFIKGISFLVTKLGDLVNLIISEGFDAGTPTGVAPQSLFEYPVSEVSLNIDKNDSSDYVAFSSNLISFIQSNNSNYKLTATKVLDAREMWGANLPAGYYRIQKPENMGWTETKREHTTHDAGSAESKKGILETINMSKASFQIPNVRVTPITIFSNQVPMLNANYFSNIPATSSNSATLELKGIVSSWYKMFRVVTVVGLLAVLAYLGIRIMISSIAEDKSKYKQTLVDWVVAMCLVFCLHYIMAFMMTMVDTVTDVLTGGNGVGELIEVFISNEGSDTFVDDQGGAIWNPDPGSGFTKPRWLYKVGGSTKAPAHFVTNMVGYMRLQTNQRDTTSSLVAAVLYLALSGYTVYFTWIYLKRLLVLTFLTFVAPLVALTYPIDKFRDGKAQAFNYWLREYTVNAMLPIIHLILYLVFVQSAIDLAVEHPIYAIAAMAFIVPAEKMIKEMFGIRATNDPSSGAFKGAAAAGLIASLAKRGAGALGKGGKGKDKDKEDGGSDEQKVRQKELPEGSESSGGNSDSIADNDEIGSNLNQTNNPALYGGSGGSNTPQGNSQGGGTGNDELPPPPDSNNSGNDELPSSNDSGNSGDSGESGDSEGSGHNAITVSSNDAQANTSDNENESDVYSQTNYSTDDNGAYELGADSDYDMGDYNYDTYTASTTSTDSSDSDENEANDQIRTEDIDQNEPEEIGEDNENAADRTLEDGHEENRNNNNDDNEDDAENDRIHTADEPEPEKEDEPSENGPENEEEPIEKSEAEKEAERRRELIRRAQENAQRLWDMEQHYDGPPDPLGSRAAYNAMVGGNNGIRSNSGSNTRSKNRKRGQLRLAKNASKYLRRKYNIPRGAKGVATVIGRMLAKAGKAALKTGVKATAMGFAAGTMGAIGLAGGIIGGDLTDAIKGATGGIAAGAAAGGMVANRINRRIDKPNSHVISNAKDTIGNIVKGDDYAKQQKDKKAVAGFAEHLQDDKGLSKKEAQSRAETYLGFSELGVTDVEQMDKLYDSMMSEDNGINNDEDLKARLEFYKENYKDQLGVSNVQEMNQNFKAIGQGDTESKRMEEAKKKLENYQVYRQSNGLNRLSEMERATQIENDMKKDGKMTEEQARRTTAGIIDSAQQYSAETYQDPEKFSKKVQGDTDLYKSRGYSDAEAKGIAEQKNKYERYFRGTDRTRRI